MTLVRWRPFRDLFNVQDEVNRMFEGFFDRSSRSLEEVELCLPAADVYENKDDIIFSVELPGLDREDIKVTVQDNILTIKGEKKQEKEEKDTSFHRLERSYGFFTRSFSLPTTVQADKIRASYDKGVLRVELPKAEEVKPKEIPISVSDK